MRRRIVLDTETTGLNVEKGHRLIEIGCIEIIDRKITSNYFHTYLNPQREVEEGAFNVHGISTQFLQDKPLFKDIVDEFIRFVCDSELIIHNAPFDLGFINAELQFIQWPKQLSSYCSVCDTLLMAKEKHPGQRNNLDALCKRYQVDNSNRQFHGALLDAEILALVYLAMTGGQISLFAEEEKFHSIQNKQIIPDFPILSCTTPVIKATKEELKRHREFVEFLKQK